MIGEKTIYSQIPISREDDTNFSKRLSPEEATKSLNQESNHDDTFAHERCSLSDLLVTHPALKQRASLTSTVFGLTSPSSSCSSSCSSSPFSSPSTSPILLGRSLPLKPVPCSVPPTPASSPTSPFSKNITLIGSQNNLRKTSLIGQLICDLVDNKKSINNCNEIVLPKKIKKQIKELVSHSLSSLSLFDRFRCDTKKMYRVFKLTAKEQILSKINSLREIIQTLNDYETESKNLDLTLEEHRYTIQIESTQQEEKKLIEVDDSKIIQAKDLISAQENHKAIQINRNKLLVERISIKNEDLDAKYLFSIQNLAMKSPELKDVANLIREAQTIKRLKQKRDNFLKIRPATTALPAEVMMDVLRDIASYLKEIKKFSFFGKKRDEIMLLQQQLIIKFFEVEIPLLEVQELKLIEDKKDKSKFKEIREELEQLNKKLEFMKTQLTILAKTPNGSSIKIYLNGSRKNISETLVRLQLWEAALKAMQTAELSPRSKLKLT